ncbi:MAG: ribosomal-protein-alanine N-acetyltransferase [Micromonosporaceae bacterium]|nr:ribosomal-protein-alanine N-acetyltransferase [Micromonosporaceae bacterium]
MTPAEVRLEPMRAVDLDEILAIEEDLFGAERWTAGMFRSELDSGHHYLVARDGAGRVAGYGGLAVLPGEEAWVNNLAVRRDAQRRGVGRELLTALLAEAKRRDAPRVLLEVAADNLAAQRLYAGFGFAPLSVRRGYYQPSNTDALVMVRAE